MKENLNDLRTFLIVAETGSFTKAGAVLGITQSAVSFAMKGLEQRLNIKLLERTTRSVSTTQAGEQLRRQIEPLFAEIEAKIADLDNFRDQLGGSLRISGTEHAFHFTLREKFLAFMQAHPEVQLELVADNRFTDIVAERFDAGIRLGSDVEKDMIAIKIAEDLQMATVATADYWAKYGTPKHPYDLSEHNCLALRLPTNGDLLAWHFLDPKTKSNLRVQPQGKLIGDNQIILDSLKVGLGVAWLPKDMVLTELANGELVEVLPKWQMRYEGYHLYYPSRRADNLLFKTLVQELKI